MQSVYDEHGRYDPLEYFNFLEEIQITLGLPFAMAHVGIIDAFSFCESSNSNS